MPARREKERESELVSMTTNYVTDTIYTYILYRKRARVFGVTIFFRWGYIYAVMSCVMECFLRFLLYIEKNKRRISTHR